MDADELAKAAETGDLASVETFLQAGPNQPTGDRAAHALVAAAAKNQVEAVRLFLDYGAPLAAKNKAGQLLLHTASNAGAAQAVGLLCSRKADIDKCDHNGATPLTIALKAKKLGVIKELLRAGAELPKEVKETPFPGLSGIIQEVQLEKLTDDLKAVASRNEVSQENLNAIDKEVWTSQQEHMRLVRIFEQQKAGSVLTTLEAQRNAAREEEERVKAREESLKREVELVRSQLIAAESHYNDTLKELTLTEADRAKAEEEDRLIRAELAEGKTKLEAAKSELKASQQTLADKEALRDRRQAEREVFESESKEARLRRDSIRTELEEARDELEGWTANREAAAALTAQAHRLLGTGN